jgi:transcriptional regulator of NAD metabolism
LKIYGAPKPPLLKDLNLESAKQEQAENDPDYDYEEGDSEDETEDALSWMGIIELDTVLYPTMKGTLDIDERGTVYNIVASLTLPDGVAEIRDEFDFVVSKCLVLSAVIWNDD